MRLPKSLPAALALLLSASTARAASLPSDLSEKRLSNGIRVLVLEQPGSGWVHARMVFRDGSEVWSARPQAAAWVARAVLGPLPATDLAPSPELESLLQRLEGTTDSLARAGSRQSRLGAPDPELEDLTALAGRLREQVRTQVEGTPDVEAPFGPLRDPLDLELDGVAQGVTLPASQLGAWLQREAQRLAQLRLTRLPLLEEAPPDLDRQIQDLALTTAFPGAPVSPSCPPGSRPGLAEARALAHQLFSRERMALVIAGDVAAAQAFDLAERSLASLSTAPPWTPPAPRTEASPTPFGGRRLAVVWDHPAQLVVAWPMPSADDRDYERLRLAADLLGEGPEAMLPRRLMEQGLARTVTTRWIHQGAAHPGLLLVQVHPEEGRGLAEVALALEGEIRRFLQEPLDPQLVERRQRRNQLLERLTFEDPRAATLALAQAWRRTGDWRRAFAAPAPEDALEASATLRRAFHPDRKTELLLEAHPESALRDPLDQKLAQALRRLAQTRNTGPAQVEALVSQALRQLRMLDRAEREGALRILEGSGARR